MRFLSLFAGIGGLDLGLERAGMTCAGQVEIEPFCREVLARHWPHVPRWADVRAFTGGELDGPVDLVCGGFPCQDISAAGKGAGIDGERSGLWREMFRIIGVLRPRWVLAENVPVLRTRGADRVLGDLEGIGYACWPVVVGAEHVGAPHRRHRVFIVAHAVGGAAWGLAAAEHTRLQGQLPDAGQPQEPEPRHDGASAVADAELVAGRRQGREGSEDRRDCDGHDAGRSQDAGGPQGRRDWPARPGEPQHEWEAPRLVELPVGGEADGVPARLVRAANRNALKALGNAVVPQVAEVIGRAILEAERGCARAAAP